MTAWWAPGAGYGHATRVAAIARHMTGVRVYRDRAECNEPLDHYGIEWCVSDGPTVETGELLVWDAPPEDAPEGAVCVHKLTRAVRDDRFTFSVEHSPPPNVLSFWPIISLPWNEIHSREAARKILDVGPDENVTLVVASARWPKRIEDAFKNLGHVIVIDSWPALPLLPAADLVAGSAGTNLFAEVHYLGLSAVWAAACEDQQLRLAEPGPGPGPHPDQSMEAAGFLSGCA